LLSVAIEAQALSGPSLCAISTAMSGNDTDVQRFHVQRFPVQRFQDHPLLEVRFQRWASTSQRQDAALRLWNNDQRVIGRDDHELDNGDFVFVVDHTAHYSWWISPHDHGSRLKGPIQEVDEFHGVINGCVIAQLCYHKIDVFANEMLHLNGCFAKAMRYIQRLFRARRRVRQIYRAIKAGHLLPKSISKSIMYAIATWLPRCMPIATLCQASLQGV